MDLRGTIRVPNDEPSLLGFFVAGIPNNVIILRKSWETRVRLYGPSGHKNPKEHYERVSSTLRGRPRPEWLGKVVSQAQKKLFSEMSEEEKESRRIKASEAQVRRFSKPGAKDYLHRKLPKERVQKIKDSWRVHDELVEKTANDLQQLGAVVFFKDLKGNTVPDIFYYRNGEIVGLDVKTKSKDEIDVYVNTKNVCKCTQSEWCDDCLEKIIVQASKDNPGVHVISSRGTAYTPKQ